MRDSLGSSRGINRHRYSVAEAEEELQRPVVQALLELCRFRNSHPAFNGEVGHLLSYRRLLQTCIILGMISQTPTSWRLLHQSPGICFELTHV